MGSKKFLLWISMENHTADRDKTVFSAGNKLYQFKVLPFGLCSAPVTYEKLVEFVLKGLKSKTCLVYLKGFMGKTFDNHLEN